MKFINMFSGIFFQLMVLTLFIALPVTAQVDTTTNGADQSRVNGILQEMQQEMGQQSQMVPDSVIMPPTLAQQQMLDDSTLAMYQNAMYAYYEYRVSGFAHRKNVFAWQLFSTKLIFWSVLILVFSGIAFSGIQFYKSIKLGPDEGAGPTGGTATEFEASAKGIKVTSPVLGVIILVISLAFFYLYLVYVYPISEIF
ncbi:hypothetical protein NC796_05570 [Aliifodinibius sp. S!AR15-10]|uniref:hypothetical protein n=1 Tax=Aliifodinibius sp. S!AR15-10 TaxID=2950437 RepID=UPI0028600368|nr:hypothetical protein [Aliifodinibius sp. S!AR15-10]MDR8390597.1 hypothetical protein [Aliifodinibius sp. S!AR15-10]